MADENPLLHAPKRREVVGQLDSSYCWWKHVPLPTEPYEMDYFLCAHVYNQKTMLLTGDRCTHNPCRSQTAFSKLKLPPGYKPYKNLPKKETENLPARILVEDWDSGHQFSPKFEVPIGVFFPTKYTRALATFPKTSCNKKLPRLCYNWLFAGRCTFWANCDFLHFEVSEMRKIMANYFCWVAQDPLHCPNKKKCPYAHSARDLIPHAMLVTPEDPQSSLDGMLTWKNQEIKVPMKFWVRLDPRYKGLCDYTWCDYPNTGVCTGVHLSEEAWKTLPTLRGIPPPAYYRIVLPITSPLPVSSPTPRVQAAPSQAQAPQAHLVASSSKKRQGKKKAWASPTVCRDDLSGFPALNAPATEETEENFLEEKKVPPSADPMDFMTMFEFVDAKGRVRVPPPAFNSCLKPGGNKELIKKYGNGRSSRWRAVFKNWLRSGERFMRGDFGTHISLQIGAGSFATVFLALDTTNGREVALKEYTSKHQDNIHAHFQTEIQSLLEAESVPGVIKYYKHDIKTTRNEETGGVEVRCSLAMELMEGTLTEAVSFWRAENLIGTGKHVLACKYVVASLLQILNDLNMEEHLGHRDIKPDNILIDRRRAIRVIDFGLARVFQPLREHLTATTSNVGSMAFAAPEAYFDRTFSRTSDIFSLGLVLRFMILGEVVHRPKLPYQEILSNIATWPAYDAYACEDFLRLMLIEDVNERGHYRRCTHQQVIKKMSAHRLLLAHPFLWVPAKCVRFLVVLGNLSDHISGLADAVAASYKPDLSWFSRVSKLLQQPPPHTVDQVGARTSLRLLKFIRDLHHHYLDQGFDPAARALLKDNPRYFLELFPSLVVRCWSVLVANFDETASHVLLREFICEPCDIRSISA